MSHVVVNRSPKSRFQESGGNISRHRELLQSVDFEKAIDWAFLQYQQQLCSEPLDINQSGAAYLKIKGAHEFVHVLRNLAESPAVEVTNKIHNLNHSA